MSIEKERQRRLVLFPGSLGDAVCALSAMEYLSQEPQKELVLAVRGEAFALYSGALFAKTVISLEGQMFSQLFLPPIFLSEEARRFFSSFSEIVSWYGHNHIQFVDNLRSLVSGHIRSFVFFSGQEYRHATAYYLDCIGVRSLKCPSLRIPEPARQWRDHYWRQQGWDVTQKILLVHPGSGGKKKRWSAEGFRHIVLWWQRQQRGKALILLGPAEEVEEKTWREIGEVVSGLSVWQTVALLSRVDRYLGNDSGVSHLAGAVGARGVVIFGPTQPQQWRPLGGKLSVLQNVAYRFTHPEVEGIDLSEISVATVRENLLK